MSAAAAVIPRPVRVRAKKVDVALYVRIRSLARSREDVRWVRRYSALGEHGGLWLGAGAAGVLLSASSRHRQRWLKATAAVGAAYLTSSTIKVTVRRRRPAVEHLPHLMGTPTGLSFPSSHATSSFAAARAFSSLAPRSLQPAIYVAAVAMAMSRVLLGVHYPSDILAGAALGSAIGTLGRRREG